MPPKLMRVVPKAQGLELSVQNAFHVGPPSPVGRTAGTSRNVGQLSRCCVSEPALREQGPVRVLTRDKPVSPRSPLANGLSDSRTPSASSTTRPLRGDLATLTKEDVSKLLETLSADQKEHFKKQSFYDQCRHKFHSLDLNKNGFLEAGELQKGVVQMFPGKQRALIEDGLQINSLANTSIESIIAAFDVDSDGRISEQEFPEFVKFCQAWRLRMYFTTPLVERPGSQASQRRAPNSPAMRNETSSLPSLLRIDSDRVGSPSSSRNVHIGAKKNETSSLATAFDASTSKEGAKQTKQDVSPGSSFAKRDSDRPGSQASQRSVHTATKRNETDLLGTTIDESTSKEGSKQSQADASTSPSSAKSDRARPGSQASQRSGHTVAKKTEASSLSTAIDESTSKDGAKHIRQDVSPSPSLPTSDSGRHFSLPQIVLGNDALETGESSHTLLGGDQTERSDISGNSSLSDITDSASEYTYSCPVDMFEGDESQQPLNSRSKTDGLLVVKQPGRRKRRKSTRVKHTWSSPSGEKEQLEALSALASAKMQEGKAFSDMTKDIFKHILARDGRAVMPEEELLKTVEEILESTSTEHNHEKPSGGWNTLVINEEGKLIDLLLAVTTRVSELAECDNRSLVGQILWRFRSTVQRQGTLKSHARAVEDMSWVAGPELLENVKGVFTLFCADAGTAGHMHCREWMKCVHLMTLDPVLRDHIQLCDIDRLFYTSSHRDAEDVTQITCDEFLRLIVSVADSSKVHPQACMLAIGCHEEKMRGELKTKGNLPPDYIKQFYH